MFLLQYYLSYIGCQWFCSIKITSWALHLMPNYIKKKSINVEDYVLKNAFLKKNLVWPHEVSQRILLIPASCAILLSLQCHMFLLKYYLLYIGGQCFCLITIIPIFFMSRSLVMCSFKKLRKTMERSEIFKDEKSP